MEKHKLWLMCGIPGSGKSTWLKNHMHWFNSSTKVVSRDAIRFGMITEEDEYFSRENDVWVEFIKQAKESLAVNDNTILDATHLNISSRTKVLRALKDVLKGIEVNAIVLDTPLDTCLERNELREGLAKVPRGVVRRMYFQFAAPTFKEGFYQILTVHEKGVSFELDVDKVEVV